MIRRMMHAGVVLSSFSLLCGCALPPSPSLATLPVMAAGTAVSTDQVDLASGRVRFDLYLPAGEGPAPLVVVAHGFNRNRTAMAGWGRTLSAEGFVVAIPDVPGWDHPRNGRRVKDLTNWICTDPKAAARVDASRIGLVGFSNGGLWTMLAAADDPRVKIWVGLDPVDRRNLAASAAPRFKGHAMILKAPPSKWNHNGNCEAIERALPEGWAGKLVPNAVHLDPEWPTDPRSEFILGKTSDERRMIFVSETVAALKRELLIPRLAGS